MARRHRTRKAARQTPFREPKPIILVLCEGRVTEPQYLTGFALACENPRVQVEIVDEYGNDPKTLVKKAKDLKRKAEADAKSRADENLIIDSVWCVFDVDEHHSIPEAVVMARDNKIQLAISNPSFELWLLLHFQESCGMQNRSTVRKLLQSHVADYDKHVDYEKHFAHGYEDAVKRSEQLDKLREILREGNHEHNPSTGVFRLTESVRQD